MVDKKTHRRHRTQLFAKDMSQRELDLSSQQKKGNGSPNIFKQKYEILNMKYEGFKTQLAELL
jgi:hypothetical protein